MGILQTLKLKSVETVDENEVKEQDIKFIFKKDRKVIRRKKTNVVTISKHSIAIRPDVIEQLNMKQGKGSAALVLWKNQISLIYDSNNIDDQLYSLIWGANKGVNKYSTYVNVPKSSQEFVGRFKGNYQIGEIVSHDHYKIAQLLKENIDE